jgi:hypothetical protein
MEDIKKSANGLDRFRSLWSAGARADFRSMSITRLTHMALAAIGALTASAALALPAHAASLVTEATDCANPGVSQRFADYGDANWYKPVDGGAFEAGAPGWTLNGGAVVVGGKLSLPAGSRAVSAPVCVSHDEPTLRFFGAGTGVLSVAVQVQLLTGTWLTLPIGVDAGAAWRPSPTYGLLVNYLPPAREYTAVRFVLAPLLGGWRVDDVYVDPRNRA